MTQPGYCPPTATVFGVSISSPLRLWQSVASTATADVVVELRPPEPPGEPGGPEASYIDLGRSPVDYRIPRVARYIVEGGTTITVIPEPEADLGLVAQLTRGIALVVALHQQGRLLLHGSCFAVRGHAVSIVGTSGTGKSTLLASMMARGAALVSDGVTVLDRQTSGFFALPGPAELKLWPDAIERLGESPERFPRVDPSWDKRAFPAPGRLIEGPVPLGRVLVLAEGDREQIEPIPPSAQAFELVRNAYLVDYVSPSSHSILLKQMAEVIGHVPVMRLRRRHDPAYLDSLLDVIMENLDHGA